MEAIRHIPYVLLAVFIIGVLLGVEHILKIPTDLMHHVTVSLLAIGMALLVRLFGVCREIKTLLDHQSRLNRRIRRPVLAFLRGRLYRHLEKGRNLAGEGMTVGKEDLEDLVRASFHACRGVYSGTDSNSPGVFKEYYPTYLELQRDREHVNGDSRFLLVEKEKLREDFRNDQQNFQEFFDSHWQNNWQLYQVDPEIAAREARLQRLPSADLGVFGDRFVVFFTPETNLKTPRFQISILPLDRLELSRRLRAYLSKLNQTAARIELYESGPDFRIPKPEEVEERERQMFRRRGWTAGVLRWK